MNLLPADEFWELPDEITVLFPGVSAKEIKAWERRHKLKFPPLLRTAYLVQDGGLIRHGEVELLPLAEITWAEPELWASVSAAVPDLADPTRCIKLAEVEESLHVLYFDEDHPTDPTVYGFSFYSNVVVDEPIRLSAFIAQQQAATPEPAFEWSETERLDEILFREQLPPVGLLTNSVDEIVVGRFQGNLVVYQRDEFGQTKTVFTAPVDPNSCYLEKMRWRLRLTWQLTLLSTNPDGERFIETRRLADGLWKTETSEEQFGAEIESVHYSKLNDLIIALFNDATAKRLRRQRRRMLFGTIAFGLLFLFVLLPVMLVLIVLSLLLRILTWPIRLLFRRSSGEPPLPPGGMVIRVKPE